jgi:hypothetical protein
MESGISISLYAFATECVVFAIAVAYFILRRAPHPAQGKLNTSVFSVVTAIAAAIALWFPLTVVIDTPSSLASAHPLFLAVLIGGPLMPLILWWLIRRGKQPARS